MRLPKSEASRVALLVEYEAAQASAQHHDALVWTVSNALWAVSLVLFGFLVNVLDKSALWDIRLPFSLLVGGEMMHWEFRSFAALMTLVGIVGGALPVFALFFARQLSAVKNHKYSRCKIIEEHFGFKQHRTLLYKRGVQQLGYFVITIFMVLLWLAFLVFIWLL